MFKYGFPEPEKGTVLITGLMLLALISIVATTAFVISVADISISQNYKYEEQAFNNAEAGVQLGISRLEQALDAGMFLPPSGRVNIPDSSSPAGFTFSLSALEISEDVFNSYRFSATGTAPKDASAVIQVGVKRLPAMGFGIFGDQKVDARDNARFYSYDSRVTANPTMTDSTGRCHVASNGVVSLKMNTFIDGDLALGSDGVSDAVYNQTGVPVVTGEEGGYVGRVGPDPLNVDSDEFRLAFDAAFSVNDNWDITPSISDEKIVNPGGVVTLPGKPGGSVYFMEAIELANADVININAENGPVTIYLRGTWTAKTGSKINILNTSAAHDVTVKITEDPLNPVSAGQRIVELHHSSGLNETGLPTGFSILTDSDGMLEFKNASDVRGLVYAPRARVLMHNGHQVQGAVWAGSIEGQNGAEYYFDTALKDKYLSNEIGLTSWKRVEH